ncbi:MAG TPA: antibiotic biosynthesis monooxygenase family protein [Pseudonocardia sp.]|nr:antibiotic biosynthesis monooxygenase family protein [Pseudonocardia sp.]
MIIVSGALYVDPAERQTYLEGCVEVVRSARSAPGCRDFALSADLLDPARINVYEEWESEHRLAAFRGDGPSGEQAAQLRDARVHEHRVASSQAL